MDFHPLTPEALPSLAPYFARQPFQLSDFTLGFQLMWLPYAHTTLAETEGCLLLCSCYDEQKRFNYPLHPEGNPEAELKALAQLEAYCAEEGVPLLLGAVPTERLDLLTHRYGRDLNLTNPRIWRDYLYDFEDFVSYAGRRFSGQRNHVSRFWREWPEAHYSPLTPERLDAARAFLRVYAERQFAKHSFLANEEIHGTEQLLAAFETLHLLGGILEAEGQIIALTLGEIAGDTLVVHVEKALVEYEGVYPTIAQCFAKACQAPTLRYINREDDAGDCGLRKSKLQYNPVRLVDKYNLQPRRIIDTLSEPPTLTSQRLTLRWVPDDDVHVYARLAKDLARNRFWGWDWREAWKGEGDPRDRWFLDTTRSDFTRRAEIPLGIYATEGNTFLGEAVFHRFTYDHAVELGVRLLPEAEGQGYAAEAIRAMADYALCYWGLDTVTAKCFKDNLASKRMLTAGGLRPLNEDATFFYFIRTAKM